MNKTPNVQCLHCKKECYMPKNRLKTFKYCSRKCKSASCLIRIQNTCGICGKFFTHICSRANKAKYCSRLCYHRSQINRGTREYKCQHCNEIFFDSPSHKRKYCSRACINKCKKTNWSPKYTTIRKKMMKEDLIEKCENCGYDEVKQILGIHHKDKNRNNNQRNNLLILCPNCHSLTHNKHIIH